MTTWQKYVYMQLMMSLSDRWKHVCICPKFKWPHRIHP
jgi:hypothetical protein